ncbi:ABC transporter ATP-binding protein [Thiomicrorhabdus sp. 6S2-11]|uniref:ABC transporter ATP-binding protein n=1 Tax=Thiomicrorhabdus marina TaxID=2818442 RepID=A0ABS3Q1Z4_9GAMM|nr:ABC transporter ATP-binding protein [Thiomicrorhabdus marina]MBO1926327.1 ABC transporter ATP-binding protein [Thiomicrorhabdus marina]
MIKIIKRLLALLTVRQRRQIIGLQVLMVLMAVFEVAGVLSIGPFMAVAMDFEKINSNHYLNELYIISKLETPEGFLFLLGGASLLFLLIGSTLSTITSWRLMRVGEVIGADFASNLFTYYLSKPWLYHSQTSSSKLVKAISTDCIRVTQNILYPTLQVNAKIFLVLIMGVSIYVIDPVIMVATIVIFASVYGFIFFFVKKPLSSMGKSISELSSARFKLMSEGFGCVKEVLLLHRQKYFFSAFEEASKDIAKSQSNISIIGVIPRYALEFVAFGFIIVLVMYLIGVEGQSNVIATLSIMALAGMKLLPSFQYIYMAQSQIRGSFSSLEAIEKDLLMFNKETSNRSKLEFSVDLDFKRKFELEGILFSYDKEIKPALNKLNLTIYKNQSIALVGASGSGKSTVVDLILGLLTPQQGRILVDSVKLDDKGLLCWQKKIGYVPQTINLTENSIAENIAFGIPKQEISFQQVEKAAKLAHLDEFVSKLPEGLETSVGERGVQLSGGQRQRIGIARALYNDPEILVLDEATSALDGVTETLIMNAIHEFAGNKTIIVIAHRLSTVESCDQIYLLDSGEVVSQGSYQDLINENDAFKRMAGKQI